MSHGKKKWIKAYDGRIKRSNDRTTKDYYRNLKWWEPYGNRTRYARGSSARGEFCPQCKHNYKPIKAHNDAFWMVQDELNAEWDVIVEKRLKTYNRDLNYWYAKGHARGEPMPKEPRYDWKARSEFNRQNAHRLPQRPIYDEESWLCSKHRFMNSKRDEMWYGPYPGRKQHETWARRQDYRYYRSQVRNWLNKAKYDEDFYDDIPQYKKAWLD